MKNILIMAALLASWNAMAENYYAATVVDSNILDGNVGNSQKDVNRILGASNQQAVSLGGIGSWITVELGERAFNGPGADLEIKEDGDSVGGVDEEYLVYVSDVNIASSFVELGVGRANTKFDISSTNLEFVKYVKIFDQSMQTLDTEFPGSDIDSITVLNSSLGGTSNIENLNGELTGKGVYLEWSKLLDEKVNGYAVRKSNDGITFYSSVDWAVSEYEYGLLIESEKSIPDFWYSVSPVFDDGTEGIPSIVNIAQGIEELEINSEVIHLGDKYIDSWDVADFQRSVGFEFIIEHDVLGPNVEVEFEVFNVHYNNKVVINGVFENYLPVHTPSDFSNEVLIFNSDYFKSGINILEIYSFDSSGGESGNLDDLQIRNIRMRYLK